MSDQQYYYYYYSLLLAADQPCHHHHAPSLHTKHHSPRISLLLACLLASHAMREQYQYCNSYPLQAKCRRAKGEEEEEEEAKQGREEKKIAGKLLERKGIIKGKATATNSSCSSSNEEGGGERKFVMRTHQHSLSLSHTYTATAAINKKGRRGGGGGGESIFGSEFVKMQVIKTITGFPFPTFYSIPPPLTIENSKELSVSSCLSICYLLISKPSRPHSIQNSKKKKFNN